MQTRNRDLGGKRTAVSRRTALGIGSAALAGFAAGVIRAGEAREASLFPPEAPRPAKGLRAATCQFPVSASVTENARHIRDSMRRAVKSGAHLLHTSEASLSGYAGIDLPSLDGYDWELLRCETTAIRGLAKELDLWLVLGSTHHLDAHT
ncbi:MAG: carbon-nitrogen hydrolase family protein [Verrucomicrobia bacterium]|nr:carbon-nitrogen hydrolase family protein [Verrucomicrobiota bacterium]